MRFTFTFIIIINNDMLILHLMLKCTICIVNIMDTNVISIIIISSDMVVILIGNAQHEYILQYIYYIYTIQYNYIHTVVYSGIKNDWLL